MPRAKRWRLLALVAAATLITGVAWGIVIPPFEGLDESHYYQVALAAANGPAVSHNGLFYAITTPLLRMICS